MKASKQPFYAFLKLDMSPAINQVEFTRSKEQLQETVQATYPKLNKKTELKSKKIEVGVESTKVEEVCMPFVGAVNESDSWGIRITPACIFLHTRDFDGFDDLKDRFKNLLSMVSECLNATHFNFVGVRYIYRFEAKKEDLEMGKEFQNVYKRKEFLHPKLAFDLNCAGSNLNVNFVKDSATLNINSGVQVDGYPLPPEFIGVASDLFEVNEELRGVWAHLDIDSNIKLEEPKAFEQVTIMDLLDSIEDYANSAKSEIIYS